LVALSVGAVIILVIAVGSMQRSPEESTKAIVLTDASLEKAVGSHSVLVVDCWARWCPPCRMMTPIIEDMAERYEGIITFGKLDVDRNRKTVQDYGIRSIPTFLVFVNGTLVDRIVGAMPGPVLEERLVSYLPEKEAGEGKETNLTVFSGKCRGNASFMTLKYRCPRGERTRSGISPSYSEPVEFLEARVERKGRIPTRFCLSLDRRCSSPHLGWPRIGEINAEVQRAPREEYLHEHYSERAGSSQCNSITVPRSKTIRLFKPPYAPRDLLFTSSRWAI